MSATSASGLAGGASRILLAAALVATYACRPTGSGAALPSADDQRAVLTALRHPVELAGQPAARMDLRERMATYAVPGVSVAVIRGNRIAWSAAIGRLRADAPDPMTRETLLQAASISKPLVAVATLRLVERGELALEDSANAHLKSWRIPANAMTSRSPVRVEQLLSHTAGATNGAVGIYPPSAPVPTLLQALDGAPPSNRPPVRIDQVPGTTFRYSGGGYSILQQLLIDVGGTTFPTLMRDLVLAPAGMRASCFCQPLPDSLAPRAASGHDSHGTPISGGWWTLPEAAAGGLWATADDLARFMIAVNGAWRGEPDAFLSQRIARRMLARGAGGWGLGFEVDTIGGELRYSHTGSNNGYRSTMIAYPGRGDGIVVLTNGDGGADLRDEIVRSAALAYGWPGDRPVVRTESRGANPSLGQFSGRFQYTARFASSFTVSGDTLVARLNDGSPNRLYSERPDIFFSIAGTTYRFVRDAGGQVTQVVATFGDGSQLTGARVSP